MAGNVNGHRIVVQRIADRPRAACRAHSCPQTSIADQRSTRDRLELVQDLLLERIDNQSQIGIMTQRVGSAAEIAVDLLADGRNSRVILDRIELQSQFRESCSDMGCILDVMIKDNSAGALGYQQIAQIRFHKTDSRLGPANPLERLIKLRRRAEQQFFDDCYRAVSRGRINEGFYFHIFHHLFLSFLIACETFARALSSEQSMAAAIAA